MPARITGHLIGLPALNYPPSSKGSLDTAYVESSARNDVMLFG